MAPSVIHALIAKTLDLRSQNYKNITEASEEHSKNYFSPSDLRPKNRKMLSTFDERIF